VKRNLCDRAEAGGVDPILEYQCSRQHLAVDSFGPAGIAVLSALTHTPAAASPFTCWPTTAVLPQRRPASREQCVSRCR